MNTIWNSRGWQAYLLAPVALFFSAVVFVRARLFKIGWLKSIPSSLPVIVVGNISVGGTGKTPIVSAVVAKLKSAGFRPGIVSRGYGAKPAKHPRLITADMPIELAGDEPSLLSNETGVPVCICISRAAAVSYLANETSVNVVVSDDGLQHYAMTRDIEVVVVDGQRLLGNRWILPAGPLREPPGRLNSVDVIAVQQTPNTNLAEKHLVYDSLQLNQSNAVAKGSFYLDIVALIELNSQQHQTLSEFKGRRVHAIAGVGNPNRFFNSLRDAGLDVIEHAMSDHHKYVPADIEFNDKLPILMTTKDAVKIREFDIELSNLFEVSVKVVFDEDLEVAIDHALNSLK